MSADIGPGTPLICIDNSPHFNFMRLPCKLTVGALYFCSELDKKPDAIPGCCPKCSGIVHIRLKNYGRKSYCPSRFRPLNDGDTSLVDREADFLQDQGLASLIPIEAEQLKELV